MTLSILARLFLTMKKFSENSVAFFYPFNDDIRGVNTKGKQWLLFSYKCAEPTQTAFRMCDLSMKLKLIYGKRYECAMLYMLCVVVLVAVLPIPMKQKKVVHLDVHCFRYCYFLSLSS